MNTEQSIKHYAPQTPGDTTRTVCPFCHATHEKSFEIRRLTHKPHLLTFRCYRGTCGEHGWVVDKDGTRMILNPSEKNPEKLDKRLPEHSAVPDAFYAFIVTRYRIFLSTQRRQGFRWKADKNTLCMPWLDNNHRQIGWVEKHFGAYVGGAKSHHDLCAHTNTTRLAFPTIHCSYTHLYKPSVCVLTEDLLSAYRVNQDGSTRMYGVAMLGTSLRTEDAQILGRIFKQVMVHTDQDVWPNAALQIMDTLKPFTSVKATTAEQDIKDMSIDDLKEHLAYIERCW